MPTGINLRQVVRDILLLSALSSAGTARVVAADSSAPAADALDEITVVGRQFNYNYVESANKLPIAVIDTPQSVQVITADELEFAGVKNFNDLYKLDAGSAPNFRRDFLVSYFRGFQTGLGNSLRVDGFRQLSSFMLDFSPYERVEIVKGAVSTLYGQSAIAGMVNAVSKQPQREAGGTLKVEAGQWDHYRVDADLYGALFGNEQLTGRLVAAYLNEKSSYDFWYQRSVVVAPSVRFEFSDHTSILLQLDYQSLNTANGDGLPAAVNLNGAGGASNPANYQIPSIPFDKFNGSPPWAHVEKNFFSQNLRFEHEFGDWHLRTNLAHLHYTNHAKFVYVGAFAPISTDKTSTTNIYTYFGEEESSQYSGEVDLFGDVDLFGHKQTIFFGVDDQRTYEAFLPYAGSFLSGEKTGFNIYDPNWSLIPAPTSALSYSPTGVYQGGFVRYWQDRSNAWGATMQAFLRPTDSLTINLGIRHSTSSLDESAKCCDYAASLGPQPPYASKYPQQSANTFQGGVVYTLIKNVNAYASWGQTFDVNDAFAFDPSNPAGKGIFLGPNKGVTYESGLKGQLFADRVFWSADLFNTEQSTVIQGDPGHPGFATLLGAQRSRGWEMALQGKVTPEWDVGLQSTGMINKFIGGQNDGAHSPFAPRFAITAYSSYQFQGGPLDHLGFGGGVVHQTRPAFELRNGARYPQLIGNFTTFDVRAFYDRDLWRFQLSATNVTDTRFYSPTFQTLGFGFEVNPPRQILASVSRQFKF